MYKKRGRKTMERIKRAKRVLFFALISVMALAGTLLVGCNENEVKTPEVPIEYSITYAGLEDAENPNTVTTFTASSGEIALKDPVKEGYPFEGWTYKGEKVTAIDGKWGQDVTLVATWGAHYCHIELEWEIPEEYRFYFVGEPFQTGFYVEGKWWELAPKVWLKFGEDGEVYIPYINGVSLRMEGFDSKTAGIKHVTVNVRNIYAPDGQELIATKTYDVEVRDYDSEYYGYITQPEDVHVVFPAGYSFFAEVKNERSVIAYNWMDTLEDEDPESHAESCSQQTYNPYNFLHGSTAFTNTLVVPSSFNSMQETYKLLTVYEDFTRVYSDRAVAHVDTPTSIELENYARLGEYVFGTDDTRGGQPFSLEENGIGSGTISFIKTEKGAEFTFSNVNFVNSDYKCDSFNSSVGFEYFYVKGLETDGSVSESGEYYIHLVGDNYFVNTYLADGASGININFQNPRQIERLGIINYGTLTIDGSGTLNLVGGAPSLYANCLLTVQAKIYTSPYVGRNSSGIVANDITVSSGAAINSTGKGIALTAMVGNVTVESGAAIDLNLVIPKRDGTAAGITAIQAGADVRFYSDHVNISVSATPEIYQIFDNQKEGVDKCILVSAGRAVVLDDGAKVNMKVFASNSKNTIPVFGMIYGLSGGSGQDNGVFIENSTLNMDFQADLFYGIYAIAADSTIEIIGSAVSVRMKCMYNMNGIYCENGNVGIINSTVSVTGRSAYVYEAPTFGVFSGPFSSIEVYNSKLDIELNRGLAVAGYFAWRSQPADYDEDYSPKPKLLDGFDLDGSKNVFGLYSVFAEDDNGNHGFHVLETVYDVNSGDTSTEIHVDNR